MDDYLIKDRRNTKLPPLGLQAEPTLPRGQHDVASPGSSNSGANSGSSQSGLSNISHYSHGSWPAPGNQSASAYAFSSGPSNPGTLAASAHHQYDYRTSTYDTGSAMYPLSRAPPASTSASATATGGGGGGGGSGDGLSTPTYGHGHHQHFAAVFGGHGGGGGGGSSSATLPSHNHGAHGGSLLGSHHTSTSGQPPTPVSAHAAHADPYGRSSSTPSYFSNSSTTPHHASTFAPSTPHQPSFPPFQPSSSATSPTTSTHGSRGAPHSSHSFSAHPGHPSSMAPPQTSYRPYSYSMHVPSMSGTIMSNLNNPGGQMSVMPGLAGVHGYGHLPPHALYGHSPPNPQSDRQFKCDQCVQAFNRNHDLKRHKRIHLAIKPFPCGSCDKAFSRKDALKRHRLVKGCGEQNKDNPSASDDAHPSGRSDTSPSESPTFTNREET